jgi:integrase
MGKPAVPIPWSDLTNICERLRSDGQWRDLLILTIPRVSGFRVSDWSDICWHDILNDDGTPRDLLFIKQKKTSSFRTTPFSDQTKEIICTIRDNMIPYWNDPDNPKADGVPSWLRKRLFPTKNGKERAAITGNGMNYIIKKIFQRYGHPNWEDYSSHSLRKAYSIRLFNSYAEHDGADKALIYVQHILGHRSALTTMKYLGIWQMNMAKAPQFLDL